MSSTAKRVASYLIVASVAILGALAAVRVVGYIVVENHLRDAMETVQMADIANSQKGLSQQISKLVHDENPDLAELKGAIERFSHNHKRLSTSNVATPQIEKELVSSDLAVTHIIVAAGDYVEDPSKQHALGVRKEVETYRDTLDKKMTRVHQMFVKSVDHRILSSQSAHLWMLVIGLSFTAFAIIIVAGPLRARLKSTVAALEESQRIAEERAVQLDQLSKELEIANSELKERHVKLRKAYDESSSANQFLMLASARFEDLFHGVPFPCFSVDANGTIFEWNTAASQMFGVEGHETIQKPIYGKFFSLDNDFLLKGLIAEAFRGHHLTNIEIEAICPEGTRQLLISVFPLKAARQEPTAALIACADITLQKDAEQRANEANERVGAILDSIKDAFVTVDRDMKYRYVNNTAASWLGMEPEEIVGKTLLEVSPNLEGSKFIQKMQHLIESGEWDSFEHFFESADVWLEFRVYPSQEGVSVFYNDITVRKADEETIRQQREQLEETMLKLNENSVLLEQQQIELEDANRHLRELAITDGLTGLLNHRAMQDELAKAAKASSTEGSSLSVALLDVDHFKKFNDSFGHQEGDVVLRKVAEMLTDSVRGQDIVARYGGEEFCVILPDTDEAEALVVCERIRKTIEDAAWSKRQVTVSVGVTTGQSVTDTQGFIKQADEALYEAKAGGRNCVRPFRSNSTRCA